MSVRRIKAGTTDVSVVLRIVDSTDGTPETGVVFNTSGIDLWYRRELAASVDITEATLAALTTAHTDGGFLHINDGWYRLDLPDAACATGVPGVQIGGTVTGMVVLAPYIELVAYDPYDTVRLGLTALPNAAADAAGGLPISDAGGLDLDAQKSDVAAILVDTGTTLDGKLDTIDNFLDTEMAAVLAAVDTEVAAILADTGELQTDWANGGRLDLILDARASQASVDTVDSNVDAILADTGTDGVVVAAGSKTGYSLAADQSGVTVGTVNSLASGAIAAASLAAAACAKVADVVLRRTFANARGSSDGDTVSFRSLLGAVAKLVNKIDTTTNAGKLTVFIENDSTELGTQTLGTDAAAEPIVSADTD